MYLIAFEDKHVSQICVNNTWCVCEGVEVKGRGVKRDSERVHVFLF